MDPQYRSKESQPSKAPEGRRASRKILRGVGFGLLGVLVVSALLIGALTATSPGKRWLAVTISSFASSDEQQIDISGLDGIWSGEFRVDNVRLSDPQGVFLEVDGVSVSWSPFALFGARFDAESIQVDRVRLDRLPSTPAQAETPNEEEGSGGLPVELKIGSIQVNRIEIGEAVAGVAADLKTSGNLVATASPIEIIGEMTATKIGGSEGQADISFEYRPDANEAGIKLSFNEAAQGLLAGLLNLPGKPATAIKLSGQGPLSDWDIVAKAAVGGESVLDLTGNARMSAGDASLKLAGSGFPDKLSPPAYREILAGQMAIDLSARRSVNGQIEIETAKLEFGKFFAAARGVYNPEGQNSLTGGISAKQAAINLAGIIPGLANLAPKDIAFAIEGSGRSARIEVTGDIPLIDAGEVAIIGLKTRLFSPSFDLGERSGPFELAAEFDEARSGNENISRLLQGAGFLSVEGTADSAGRIRLSSILANNRTLEATANGQVDLSPFAIELTPSVTIKPEGLPAALSERLSQPVRATADISAIFARERTINISNLAVDGTVFKGKGSADLSGEDVEADFALTVSQLQTLLPGAVGTADIKLGANGPMSGPVIDLEAASELIELNGRRIENLEFSVSGDADLAMPDLAFRLDGAVDGLALTGNGRLHMVDGKRVLENFRIRNADNEISGQFSFDDKMVPTGALSLSIPDIGPLAALALQEASGSLNGTIRLDQRDGAAFASLQASSAELIAAGNRISGLSANIRATDYLSRPVLDGSLKVESVLAGATRIGDIQLDLKGDGLNTDFTLKAKADGMPVDLAGLLSAGEDPIALRLDRAKTVFKDVPVALAQPVTIKLPSGGARIENAVITVGGGSVTISGQAGEALDLDIGLSRVDAGVVNAFAPSLGAKGTVSGSVKVSGTPGNPAADFDLGLSGAQISQMGSAGVDPVNIEIDGRFADQTLSFRSTASGIEGLSVKAGGNVGLAGGPTLDLDIDGNLPLAILAATLAQNGISLTGTANAKLSIAGNASSPQINGTVTSNGTRLVHAPSGIAIEDIRTQVDLASESVRIASLDGNLSTGGRISGQGSVSLNGAQNFPADFSLDVNDAVYSDGKIVNTKLDAKLKLEGALLAEPSLTGQVNLGRTVITVPETLPSSVSRLNVQHRNADAAVREQAESLDPVDTGSNASGLRLNMTVNAPNQVFIRGRGIDAELGGKLQLFGPVNAPLADGAFNLIRGRLDLLDRRLDFTSGSASFSGSLIPDIDIRAETLVEDTQITVRVYGPANAPQFALSSSPALAEDEILARLIFRRDIANLSAFQIAQLAQAAATLAGKGGNSSLMTRFQNLLGVDDIDVRTDAQTGETTVGVGKYVNERTYIGVEQGESAGTGKATINLDIGRGLKLRGEASESGDNKAGIFYEREY